MEAPGDDCLVYCGGEDTHPFDRIARPAPRGHKPQHPGAAGGFLMKCLLAAVERSSARVECDARADALVLDSAGRVAGLVATRAGRALAVRARRGVVLTAGGFVLDAGMVERHCPAAAQLQLAAQRGPRRRLGHPHGPGRGRRGDPHGCAGVRDPAHPAAPARARRDRGSRRPALHQRGRVLRSDRPGRAAAPRTASSTSCTTTRPTR